LEALREQGDPEAIARGERIVGGAAPAAPAAKAAAEPEPEPEPEPVLEPEPEPVLEPEPLVQAAADAGAGELAASEEDEEAALGAFDGLHIEEEPPGAVAGEALDLELEEPLRDPVEAAEAVDFGAPALEVDGQGSSADAGSEGDEELVFAEEGDQMATRLDLARAYLDMGDQDGARSILEEVARSGNAEQQQEANTLLARLG
jgi:pilus assembly protein FimV